MNPCFLVKKKVHVNKKVAEWHSSAILSPFHTFQLTCSRLIFEVEFQKQVQPLQNLKETSARKQKLEVL